MNSLVKVIAKEFSDSGITWGIGGSLVLKRHGIELVVKDIDILTTVEDFEIASKILEDLGKSVHKPPYKGFESKRFASFEISGIEVDLMAGYQVFYDDNIYSYMFTKASVSLKDHFENGVINYTSLEDWYILYLLMNRVKDKGKIKALEAHFRDNGILRKDLLDQALKNAPDRVIDHVKEKLGIFLNAEIDKGMI
ncbi:MAG: hypothetical protein WC251_03185 [Candidatus Izemoplasmatales bacterium]|jgi:hypothetical protein